MSNGVYGIKRASDVQTSDMEVFMTFAPNRNTRQIAVTKLPTNEVVFTNNNPNGSENEILGGLYTLRLPKEYFTSRGIYTIMIKPIEIRTKITDVGVLSTQPNIRGLVLSPNTIDSSFSDRFNNNSLIGYRIEYLDSTNTTNPKINNLFRIITSNNKATVNQSSTTTTSIQRAQKYNLTDSGDVVFCTVTPNSPNSAKPNVNPFIGEVGQDIILTNTFFDPIMIEVEMVEYDTEDIAIGMFGNQSKSLDDGIWTLYNFDNEIYKQYSLYEIKDEFTDKPLFEVREKNDTIDDSKEFDNITNIDG